MCLHLDNYSNVAIHSKVKVYQRQSHRGTMPNSNKQQFRNRFPSIAHHLLFANVIFILIDLIIFTYKCRVDMFVRYKRFNLTTLITNYYYDIDPNIIY